MPRDKTKHVSCRIDEGLLAEVEEYKNLGITASRGEAISLLIEAGLQYMRPKKEELARAAEVLINVKRGILEVKDDDSQIDPNPEVPENL